MLAGGEPWLEEINVHPDHGRRGIGRALVLEVARWARTAGATVLGLTTFRDVAWNAPFYRRLGFRELAPAGLLPSHREILDDERRRGLPMERRVLMRLNLAAVAPET
jgi:GNAT superfamily N-acetyltransferase